MSRRPVKIKTKYRINIWYHPQNIKINFLPNHFDSNIWKPGSDPETGLEIKINEISMLASNSSQSRKETDSEIIQ